MSSRPPRLRGKSKARSCPYQLCEFPEDLILGIGKQVVHRLAVGHSDITGDDFANMFAGAANGEHRQRPLGVTDVFNQDEDKKD